MAENDTISNAIKLIGECAIFPGTSQFLDGNVASGAVHVVVGLAARALLGIPGLILVAANSYSQSVSNRGLYDYVREIIPDIRLRAEENPAAPRTAGRRGSATAEE
jgi:hypothetical protein